VCFIVIVVVNTTTTTPPFNRALNNNIMVQSRDDYDQYDEQYSEYLLEQEQE
jgi:hypothetical protein